MCTALNDKRYDIVPERPIHASAGVCMTCMRACVRGCAGCGVGVGAHAQTYARTHARTNALTRMRASTHGRASMHAYTAALHCAHARRRLLSGLFLGDATCHCIVVAYIVMALMSTCTLHTHICTDTQTCVHMHACMQACTHACTHPPTHPPAPHSVCHICREVEAARHPKYGQPRTLAHMVPRCRRAFVRVYMRACVRACAHVRQAARVGQS